MRRRLASLLAAGALLGSMLIVTGGITLAANQAANLDQCANGQAPSPVADGCDGGPGTQWVNGNLGASKSIYREGDSIPYRMVFTSLAGGPTFVHKVVIQWDTTKAGKHAIDYLTTWNRTVTTADPCLGISGCSLSSFDTEAIPQDPQNTGFAQIPGVFTLFGGTITNLSLYSYPNGEGFIGDKSAQIEISFTSTVANPVLAWGGHIATRQDWPGASAVSISGSPYHMRLISLDGSGGNQDRSLSADAVIFPARITVIKNADGSGATFSFSGTDFSPNPFVLTDGAATTNPEKVSEPIIVFGNHTVAESSPLPGYKLDTIVCSSDVVNGNAYTPTIATGGAGGSVSIALTEGENVICTFNNLANNPALNIVKVVKDVDGDTTDPIVDQAGDVINYTITVANTGNVTLTNITVTDAFCTVGPTYVSGDTNSDSKLQVTETWTYSCSHTVTQAEIDAKGNYDTTTPPNGNDVLRNVAVADSDESPSDDDDATVPVSPTATLVTVKSVTGINANPSTPPFVVTAAGDVVHYSITVDNTGTLTLTNITVTDAFCTVGPTYVSGDTNSDSKLQVTETWTYSCSHTVTAAELAAGGNTDTSDPADGLNDVLRNVAVADSDESPSDDDDAIVPVKAQPGIVTTDSLIPQDSIVLSNLTTGATGTLYVELQINGQCGDADPDYWKFWDTGTLPGHGVFTGNGTYVTANTVAVSEDATIRWCVSYSGDDHNAAIPLSDHNEVSKVDFYPFEAVLAGVGFALPLLAWGIWSRRKRDAND